jgi:hypothetical protein
MKTRIMLGALIMAAVIGSSVGVGYAGSDGGGSSDNANILLYQCYAVGGGSAPPLPLDRDFKLNDEFTMATVQEVGKLKLLCTLADWNFIPKDPAVLTVPLGFSHITCYEIKQVQTTQSDVTVHDAFGSQTVTVQGQSKYVCSQAITE